MKPKATHHKTSGDTPASPRSPGATDPLDHIATAAYYKAASRDFVPGQEIDDWLEAEAEYKSGTHHSNFS